MTEQEIQKKLDELAEMQAAVDALRLEKQRRIDDLIPAEVKQEIEDLSAEYDETLNGAVANQSSLEEYIKSAVVLYGVTVKSSVLQAVFNKGRAKFETERVKAYLKSQGVLDQYHTQGEPYCAIRKI